MPTPTGLTPFSRSVKFDQEARKAANVAVVTTGLSSGISAIMANSVQVQQFNRNAFPAVMSFISAAGNSVAAANDFRHGEFVKGSIRAGAALGSGVSFVYAASGGRALGNLVFPAAFVAITCTAIAKGYDLVDSEATQKR